MQLWLNISAVIVLHIDDDDGDIWMWCCDGDLLVNLDGMMNVMDLMDMEMFQHQCPCRYHVRVYHML